MSKRIKLSSLPKPLRESIMKEMGMKKKEFTSEDFIEALKNGQFAWPGGYQQYFIVDDGEALSFEAAEENKDLIIDAINEKDNNGWRVVGVDVNWEDDNLFCAHTGKKIPSAYGENEEEASGEAIPDEEVKENFLSESVKRRYQSLAGITVSLNEAEHSSKNMSSLYEKAKKKVQEMPDEYGIGGGKKGHLMVLLKGINPKKMSQTDIETCKDIIDGAINESVGLKKKI